MHENKPASSLVHRYTSHPGTPAPTTHALHKMQQTTSNTPCPTRSAHDRYLLLGLLQLLLLLLLLWRRQLAASALLLQYCPLPHIPDSS